MEVEAFVRTEMLNLILMQSANTSNSDDVVTVDKNEMIEHFGELYALKPNEFRFQPGDRKFIKLMHETITSAIEKKGRKRAMQHFGYRKEAPQMKKMKCNEIGLRNTTNSDNEQSMKSKLIELISSKLKAFGVRKDLIDTFNESFVTVESIGSDTVRGSVMCVVCDSEIERAKKKKPYNVFCRNKSGRLSWVVSNFIKHLRTHPDLKECKQKKKCQSEVEMFLPADLNESSIDDDASFLTNTSELMNMKFGAAEMDSIEKKLNDEISKQMIKAWNVATIHGDNVEYNISCTDPKSGTRISFEVATTIGNGDCMFSAAAHQIYGKKINSEEHKKLTIDLRASVVKYIQENYADFVFDIRGHVAELLDNFGQYPDRDVHGLGTIADIDDAGKRFLNECLKIPGCWAGAESLKAIHFVHNVDIIVLNENGPISYYNSSNEQPNRTIILAYRLSEDPEKRNHYDSVCNIQSDGIYQLANIISKRLNQSPNPSINLVT